MQDGDHDRSLLFLNPVKELIARSQQDLPELLAEVDRLLAGGQFLAGFFAYECGEFFMGLSRTEANTAAARDPLAWFGVFEATIEFNHRTGAIAGTLPETNTETGRYHDAVIRTKGLNIAKVDYDAALARIHGYLRDGHAYQVNFTDRIEGETDATPLALYQTLLRHQPVPFAAYLNAPAGTILSISPELFYRTKDGRITVRPMKGTWPRGGNLAEDRKAEARLLNDEKNRSEHVMIVDLLRNDLGRICTYGSVQVDKLFEVERYNTLLQMTSTCSGLLREGQSPTQVLAHLFPSGSITGAPKRRTMEIIRELEHHPRRVYTGCIGYFAPHGESCFNVAIRTVKLDGKHLTMGVGGGITADSNADEEFEECRLKAAFLTGRPHPFSLIETMRCVDSEIPLLALHMNRLSASARYFDIHYDETALSSQLISAALGSKDTEGKLRLLLDQTGDWTITMSALDAIAWTGRLLLVDDCVRTDDVFLHHKTTQRDLYERNLASAQSAGFDEVLFLNERGELTEGAISNIFLKTGADWATPQLQSGVLPGVQRAFVLEQLGNVKECALRVEDVTAAESIYVCNALRGMRPVRVIETTDGTVLWGE